MSHSNNTASPLAISSTPGIFYGWWVVAAVFVAEMFAIGSTSFAFGLFVVPAGSEFGLSRASANTGLILILIGMGGAAPLVGRLLDRFPARYVMVGGALAMGLGLVGIALSRQLWLVSALLLLLVGPGAGAIGPLAASTVVSRWFTRRRGRALGITAVATSLGGTVLVPIMSFNLELFGWRGTLIIQGVAIAVVVSLIALLFVRDRPEQMGLSTDGESPAEIVNAAPPAADRRWTLPQLLRTADFWYITLAIALTSGVSQAILVSLVPYALDLDIALPQASLLISVLAFASIIGKLSVGAIADRVDKRWLLLVISCFILLQLLVLLAEPGFMLLFIALAITGVVTGGELPVWAALAADRFGSVSYGLAMGCMSLIVTLCSIAAILFVGRAYDLTKNYDLALTVLCGFVVFALVMVLLISRPIASR